MTKAIKFGTDGWRGIIGKDFNLKNVAAVAQGLADYLRRTAKAKRRTAKVAVSYDTRRLSAQSARCIAQVLAANRIRVIISIQSLLVCMLSPFFVYATSPSSEEGGLTATPLLRCGRKNPVI